MIPIHTPHLKPSIFTNTMWAALPCSPMGSCCTRPTGCLAVSPRRARALAGSLARSHSPARHHAHLRARHHACTLARARRRTGHVRRRARVLAPASSAPTAEPTLASSAPSPRRHAARASPLSGLIPVAALAEPHHRIGTVIALAEDPSQPSLAWPASPLVAVLQERSGGWWEERGGREADSGPALHVKHASAPPLASLCTGGGLGAPNENLHASALKFHLGGLSGSIF
jgi:hypothetical protein